MDAQGFSGFAAELSRFFSIATLGAGAVLFSYGIGSPIVGGVFPPADESLAMGAGLGLLGLHGLFTKPSNVGIFRKLLCYFSGAAGGVVAWNVAVQLGIL